MTNRGQQRAPARGGQAFPETPPRGDARTDALLLRHTDTDDDDDRRRNVSVLISQVGSMDTLELVVLEKASCFFLDTGAYELAGSAI